MNQALLSFAESTPEPCHVAKETMKAAAEQEAIVMHTKREELFRVNADAGSAKTTTAVTIAKANDRTALISRTTNLAKEGEKKFQNCRVLVRSPHFLKSASLSIGGPRFIRKLTYPSNWNQILLNPLARPARL